ncbi:MAG: hypothetical protein ACLFM7_02410 [Bacteroidales bacterium]
MTRSYLILLLLGLLLASSAWAQEEGDNEENGNDDKEEKSFKEKLFFGGYLWAQFGTITQVEVAPQVGYHLSERFDVGVGAKYMYYNSGSYLSESFANYERISSHIFGGNVFTTFKVIKDLNELLPFNMNGQLIGHLEYEGLNMPKRIDIYGDHEGSRFWAHSYFVGGGLRQQVGKGGFISFMLLYNLNHQPYLPYENPIFRISFGF